MFEKFAALGPINTRHTKLKPKLDGFMDNHPTKHVSVKTFYKQITIPFMAEFAFCSEVAHSLRWGYSWILHYCLITM